MQFPGGMKTNTAMLAKIKPVNMMFVPFYARSITSDNDISLQGHVHSQQLNWITILFAAHLTLLSYADQSEDNRC